MAQKIDRAAFRIVCLASRECAQHSPAARDPRRAPDPRTNAGATLAPHCVWCSAGVVVGVGAFSGSLLGSKLGPTKWRHLVPLGG